MTRLGALPAFPALYAAMYAYRQRGDAGEQIFRHVFR
jgi:hypothetical protein